MPAPSSPASKVRAAVEERVRSCALSGDFERALNAALDGYGRELYGFLVAMAPDGDDPSDMFSQLCEELWRTFPAMRWRGGIRAWMYRVARETLAHRNRDASRELPVTTQRRLNKVIVRERTQTRPYQRTDAKQRLAAIARRMPT